MSCCWHCLHHCPPSPGEPAGSAQASSACASEQLDSAAAQTDSAPAPAPCCAAAPAPAAPAAARWSAVRPASPGSAAPSPQGTPPAGGDRMAALRVVEAAGCGSWTDSPHKQAWAARLRRWLTARTPPQASLPSSTQHACLQRRIPQHGKAAPERQQQQAPVCGVGGALQHRLVKRQAVHLGRAGHAGAVQSGAGGELGGVLAWSAFTASLCARNKACGSCDTPRSPPNAPAVPGTAAALPACRGGAAAPALRARGTVQTGYPC